VRAESLTVSQEAAVSEKSSESNLGYGQSAKWCGINPFFIRQCGLGLKTFSRAVQLECFKTEKGDSI
jgi:hypothetical protein